MKPMKTHRHNRIAAAVVSAALAGFCLSSAFAVPNYVPPPDTPIDATSLDSSSVILDNFNDFLGAIEAYLPPGTTLASSGPAPSDADFIAAVSEAVDADSANAYGIVQAAVAYNPKVIKNLVKQVVVDNSSVAEAVVSGAALANPKKAADAAASAILGLIEAGGPGGTFNSDFDEAAAEAVLDETITVIEKIASSATKSVKKALPAPGAQATAEDIAAALVTAVLNAGTGSNAELYLSAVGKGATTGVSKFTGTSKADVAVAMLDAFAAGPPALVTYENMLRLAMGALVPADFISGDHATVAAALAAKAELITPGWGDAVTAGADVMGRVKQTSFGPITETEFKNDYLTSLNADDVYAIVLGAALKAGALAPDLVSWALTDSNRIPGPAYDKAAVAGGVGGKFSGAGKVVGAAIAAGVDPTDAVTGAIPASTDLIAGKIVSSAYKAAPPPSAAASQALLAAALNAAEAAGYERALPEIAATAAKKDKANAADLATTAVNEVPNGWEEGVAAAIVAGNVATKASADAAAAGKTGADAASVALATQVAADGAASKKTVFDDALTALIANPDKARAVLMGAGAVNGKLAVPLLGASLRLKNHLSDTDSALLNYAIALNKKSEAGIRLGYEAAVDAIASPDNIFDMVDHKIFIHSKNAVDIVQGAVSARPEYAHYVARAAGFRASKLAGKIGTAAIQFSHQKVVNNDDPAAVAAISAALVLGILDANLDSAKESAAIKSAVGGLIKGVMSFPTPGKTGLVGSTADFPEATGTPGGTVLTNAKGSAGVVTGAVAQTQGPGAASGDLSSLSALVITAAAKGAKTQALAIAQAAAQAAFFVAQLEGFAFGDAADVAAIQAAVLAGSNKVTASQVNEAILVGLSQASLAIQGAGAAGILAYSHHSGLNPPVTSLANF